MELIINGEKTNSQANNLEELLIELDYTQPWFATAVNSELVPADKRQKYLLKDNDAIEILTPMQGG
ncbi:sulfur carrier protein ThiS [Bartonella sp. TP]|uniref:sulfur carrier protein ThiS n=1 Tax=Bartonella sp. TP TaxID=3057550 RepID=UPI0025B1C731|nr:sulfur carrier protein ThiS [Bartonella sp. TP]MDN5249448.1 sulfur carrier protein ThiS [Alphaproteobacteria bacterium]WJW80155.1 sulfur carrier protein ThiS [Bartonella sp. TP]